MTAPSAVLLLACGESGVEHERAIHRILGEKLGQMLGCPFLGSYDPARHRDGHYYFLPDDTLVGHVEELGIHGPEDLFGGVVERAFMATKAISHPLLGDPRRMPLGWSAQFAEQVAQVTLTGYTVFDLDDARRAGERLLKAGPLRLKPVRGKAGRGQQALHDAQELEAALARQDEQEVREWGLVLEEDLHQPDTYSVGQLRVGAVTLSYYGTQQLTRDNQGREVYGGSELVLVRGDYLALMTLRMPRAARLAIQQARLYELAAFECYPSLYASRRNYDVARGLGADGRPHCGVLEQSWRVGGASAAEVFALEAFMTDPALKRIRASTHEQYGDAPPPPGAIRLYRGEQDQLGLLSKYVKVG